jgi:hypothetical protein
MNKRWPVEVPDANLYSESKPSHHVLIILLENIHDPDL